MKNQTPRKLCRREARVDETDLRNPPECEAYYRPNFRQLCQVRSMRIAHVDERAFNARAHRYIIHVKDVPWVGYEKSDPRR